MNNPEIIPTKKRYPSYDSLAVTNIIIVEGNDDTEGDKEGIRNKFLGIIRLSRDFLQNSTPPGTIYHGRTSKEVPTKKIKEVSSQYVSAFCAPNNCLESVHKCIKYKSVEKKEEVSQMQVVDGIHSWEENEDFAYGMATSLYEKLSSGEYAGDPVADSLAIVTRDNCAILSLADGVSWGQKSKLASNCSIYGSITYICKHIDSCSNTKDVFQCILKGFEHAQACIVEENATLTTLCVAVIVQLHEKGKWCLCVVNVGDSYAYIYNKTYGVKEVTHGSHPIDEARDMRYSGGALGPADGYNPDLANLTCSLVTLDEGDIVFLCSDGISDNFDPAVAKFVPRFKIAELSTHNTTSNNQSVNNVSPLCPSSQSSKNTFPKEVDKHRHQSLGNISEHDAMFKKCRGNHDNLKTVNEGDEIPSKVTYFEFDESNPENVVESSLVPNYFAKDLNPTNITVHPSNENSDDRKPSSNEDVSIHNIKTDGNITSNINLVKSNVNTKATSNVIQNESSINIASVKDTMCSEDVSLTPRERHEGALEQMKEVINTVEFEPISQGSNTRAVDICAQIMNFVINRTAEKRDILEEHSQTEINLLSAEERKIRSQQIKKQLKDVPGKLDHASIVAYEVGLHCKESPLKLDIARSHPDAESLKEQKQPTTLDMKVKGDGMVSESRDGRANAPARHITDHGKQAYSHFV